jgi:hypothetical protein
MQTLKSQACELLESDRASGKTTRCALVELPSQRSVNGPFDAKDSATPIMASSMRLVASMWSLAPSMAATWSRFGTRLLENGR